MTGVQTCALPICIGPNKINQLAHVKYFKDVAGLKALMQKHAGSLAPKENLPGEFLHAEPDGEHCGPHRLRTYDHRRRGGGHLALRPALQEQRDGPAEDTQVEHRPPQIPGGWQLVVGEGQETEHPKHRIRLG